MKRPIHWPKGTLVVDRLLFEVKRTNSGCWEFSGSKLKNGYGHLYIDGKTRLAHRAAYEEWRGPINEFDVCHHCDNRICINPKHLFLGTKADNMADMKLKGRSLCGEDAVQARLTPAIVRECRRRYALGETQTSLAKEFGVSQSAIWLVLHRKTWPCA